MCINLFDLTVGSAGGFTSSSRFFQSYQTLPDGTAFQEFSVKTTGNDARVRLADDIDRAGNSYEIGKYPSISSPHGMIESGTLLP